MECCFVGKKPAELLSKKGRIVDLLFSEDVPGAEISIQMDHLAHNSNFVLGIDVHIFRRFNFQGSFTFD